MTALQKQCAILFLTTFAVVGSGLWLLQPAQSGDQTPIHAIADTRPLIQVHQCSYQVIGPEEKGWFSRALEWVGL